MLFRSKIIFASSVQVTSGNRRARDADSKPSSLAYLPADGELPPAPGNCYSASKVAGEVLLRSLVEHRGLTSGISVRFPGLARLDWFDWMRRHSKLDNAYRDEHVDEVASFLTFADAGRLVAAMITADLPGYRCYFPVHPHPRYTSSVAEVIRKLYPNVPLKKPIEEITSLVDISRITAETGWVPQEIGRASCRERV